MSAFDRASTGIPGLDKILDGLRWGDNVVWQVENIEEYRKIVIPFVKQYIANQYKVVYMRFGQHEPLLHEDPKIKIYELDANQGFEAFSGQVHTIATVEGEKTCYVFDSLSDLLSAWATDLMIGNFFRVTCPYLFRLDTIAYFALIKDRNTYATIARIRETTQLLLDLFRTEDQLYIHPLKVWNRYSPTMFLPHVQQGDCFVPITSSTETTQIFSRLLQRGPGSAERKIDYWDRTFMDAQELLEEKNLGRYDSEKETAMIEKLCTMVLGREERMLTLARRYFTLEDLIEIRNRLVGSGYVGGKAVGMLLARKILASDPKIDWTKYLEPHDSFYIGSDVFYTYLVENQCWELRQQQKLPENYFNLAEPLRKKIIKGSMPEVIIDQFTQMLDYFGQSPVIVRSSSLLEDGFGNAFAGKYESIFCVNQGNPQERYANFEQAVRTIFASTMNEDALAYRLQRGMADSDEQMALLVQRVSGALRSHYFFPDLAGVAMSHNLYTWHEDMAPEAGMVRLVLGLGTRAVDRVEDDYPRIIALDKPSLRPISDPEDISRFSQRKVDVLDINSNDWTTISLQVLTKLRSELSWWNEAAVPDYETRNRLQQMGRPVPDAWILTFDELLRGEFPSLIRNMLQRVKEAYAYPIDTEFTVNFDSAGSIRINLLQCRPMQTGNATTGQIQSISFEPSDLLFAAHRNTMGGSRQQQIDRVVYIDPSGYYNLPLNDKYQTARLIGRLNRLFKDNNGNTFMLIGPGRWGSSTPSLGIPVSFAEICNTSILVEVAQKDEGFMPELSFGTHFFQDLVETGIFYVAIFPGQDNVVYCPQRLTRLENQFSAYLPEYSKWADVIKVFDVSKMDIRLWLESDIKSQQTVCFFQASEEITK